MKRLPEPIHPDPEDMFADTRMSFGDHIEDLRWHLLRAIYGFSIGMVLAFCIGHFVMHLIAKPVEDQLLHYWRRFNERQLAKVLEAIKNGEYEGKELKLPRYRLDLNKLAKELNLKGFEPKADNFMYLDIDPEEYVKSTTELTLIMKPPTLATMSVQEAFVVWLKVCMLTGLVISSPWVFYQIWAFVAAGLYPHEKKLVNVYLPYSLGLFLVGVLVCEFMVIPKAIAGLLWFNDWLGLQPDLRLNEWLGFAILMPLVFGISFQTPLVMMFVERIGVVEVKSFRKYRGIAYFVIATFAAVILPTPDVLSMMMLAGPMWLLYELGIFMCVMRPRSEFEDVDSETQDMIEV